MIWSYAGRWFHPWKSLSLNIRTSDAIAGVAAACGSLRECPMSVPSHVPAELVREFDFFAAPELASAPHREMRRFHRDAPGIFYRSEEHTSELQSLMRISYAVFCLK